MIRIDPETGRALSTSAFSGTSPPTWAAAVALILDGKVVAAKVRRPWPKRPGATRAGACTRRWRSSWSGRIRPRRSTCRQEAGRAGGGHRGARPHPPAGARPRALLGPGPRLNADRAVHGILVQLPLPHGARRGRVIAAIDAREGRRRLPSGEPRPSAGRLAGRPAVHPGRGPRDPRPLRRRAEGRRGRGDRPLAHRREAAGAAPAGRHATVTMCHTRTRDLAAHTPARRHPRAWRPAGRAS